MRDYSERGEYIGKYTGTYSKRGKEMREFATGATRDSDDGKLDPEGFLSPVALKRYCEYMHEHRKQADGKMRDSDNWQKGIPISAYMKSLWRHFFELWITHRRLHNRWPANVILNRKEEALCAIIFNAFGYLHELKKDK